jgi:hypothetical protein
MISPSKQAQFLSLVLFFIAVLYIDNILLFYLPETGMRKFLGLAKPYDNDDDDDKHNHHHKFSWSWRPKSYTRRRTKSFAIADSPSRPTPSHGEQLLPVKTNPEQVSRPRSPLVGVPPNHDLKIPTWMNGDYPSNHPLSILSESARMSDRDLKARTWPYQLGGGDTNDKNDYEDNHANTDHHFTPTSIVLTPPEEESFPFPMVNNQKHESSCFTSSMEQYRSSASAADNAPKNRSGNTMENLVSNGFMHSSPGSPTISLDGKPKSSMSDSIASHSSLYQTPASTVASIHAIQPVCQERHQFNVWPRDNTCDRSFPAAINCASKFTFLPPGGRWNPGKDYKHTYLVNASTCTQGKQKIDWETYSFDISNVLGYRSSIYLCTRRDDDRYVARKVGRCRKIRHGT